ncbi:MAG: hypothetical protein K2X87_08930 [Gemmataceae bacterium]|nr:hypothetical protein [Gemmataceae bacterium]
MTGDLDTHPVSAGGRPLRAYRLGRVGFDDLLALQARLAYDVSGDPADGAVILCDHPPGVTIGREGSRAHLRRPPEEFAARGRPVRWVGRGGGALLHLPGQVACYPVVALGRLGLTPAGYVAALQGLVVDLLGDYGLTGEPDPDRPGVRINGRRVAHVGAAVRGGVTSFGLVLNANPDLEPFREVRCDDDPAPMTSLQRETTIRVRVPAVRQRLAELVAARFGFARVSPFHTHPGLAPRPSYHAVATRSR